MYELKSDRIGFIAGRRPLDTDLPTILFIHGSGGSSVLWRAQVEDLADAVNTIALDLPGHGRSGGEGMDRIEDYAEAVDGFIASMEIPPPVICGLSIGGAIVLQLLLDSPGGYRAGILVNTGARLRVMPLIFETIERDYEGFLNGTYTFSVSEKTEPSRIKPLVDSMAECPPAVALGDFRACDSFDVMERLSEIEVPVLVLTASEDRLTPVKYGIYLADHIENCARVHIDEAGHLSPMEKPGKVSRAIADFVLSL